MALNGMPARVDSPPATASAADAARPASPTPTASATASPEALVQRHLLAVWRYLRMQGADPHEADDLAQEAFVIALQKGAADLDPAATATFLRRTARFLFLRLRRDARDAIELADAADDLWTRWCEHDGGDELLDALRGCVDQLAGRAREAVALCYGVATATPLAHAAAAAQHGLQPNGLKTLLQRTRQLLRECIERRKP
jgi:RNA polymerase sigma-70 factor, ECF subfamily